VPAQPSEGVRLAAPAKASAGGAAGTTAAQVCGRLSEQSAIRLVEAQDLLQELKATAADTAVSSEPGQLSPEDVSRLQRYLETRVLVLEAIQSAHGRMGEFYGLARLHAEALEGGLEAKKELVGGGQVGSANTKPKMLTELADHCGGDGQGGGMHGVLFSRCCGCLG
jgi:hypothetical protein